MAVWRRLNSICAPTSATLYCALHSKQTETASFEFERGITIDPAQRELLCVFGGYKRRWCVPIPTQFCWSRYCVGKYWTVDSLHTCKSKGPRRVPGPAARFASGRASVYWRPHKRTKTPFQNHVQNAQVHYFSKTRTTIIINNNIINDKSQVQEWTDPF